MSYLTEALEQLFILDESAKTDFIDKFGQETFNNFEKAKQRLINKGLSVDYGQYLKKSKEEMDDLIISLYDKDTDKQKVRILKGIDKEIRGNYRYYGEIDGYKIYRPLDYISSMDLGVNTGWCTTGRYGHAGHPEFTPSEEDAKEHFNDYTSKGIKLYYFLNPTTMYGEYAIAIYKKSFDISKKGILDVENNKQILNINFELFNYEDNNIWYQPKIFDICNQLHLNIKLEFRDLSKEELNVLHNGLIWEPGITVPKFVKQITIKDGVTEIVDNAFDGCESLTTIIIPNSIVEIGKKAFCCCESLKSLILPNSVLKIGEFAFGRCTSIPSIIIPNKITKIEDWVFSAWFSLKSIVIPSNIIEIGKCVFYNCQDLESVTFEANNQLTKIGESAFSSCRSLQSITIPDSITCIEKRTFCECISLRSIIIPNNVTKIEDEAFLGCSTDLVIKSNSDYVKKYCQENNIKYEKV